MVPKGMAGFIQLKLKADGDPHVILIDDDILVRTAWEVSLSKQGLRLNTYRNPSDFDRDHLAYPTSVPLYIDLELGNGQNGADVAREYAAKGFTNIYLTTGHSHEDLQVFPHIAGIVGKMPPDFRAGKPN